MSRKDYERFREDNEGIDSISKFSRHTKCDAL